jgi:hypothetical protein
VSGSSSNSVRCKFLNAAIEPLITHLSIMQDKYEKEIEEILKNAGEEAPDQPRAESEKPLEDRSRAVRRAAEAIKPEVSYSPSKGRWPTITPGKILLVGLAVVILAALFNPLLIWVGLALLVFGYLLFFITPRSINIEKRWRGESVEDVGESPWDRFKLWFKS